MQTITLTEPVPEAFKFLLADWPEKTYFFLPIIEEVQPGDSVAFLYEVVSLVDRRSRFARGEFQMKYSTKPADEITSCNMAQGNTTRQYRILL